MSIVTIHRGEAPVTGYTLDMTTEEARAVHAVLAAPSAAGARYENRAVYGVIQELADAGVAEDQS
jgi:hypothetical protein